MRQCKESTKVKTWDTCCCYHPYPIIYPIYVNSFTQQNYFEKTGSPKLNIEMSPTSSCCTCIGLPAKETITTISIWLFGQKVHHAIHPELWYLAVECLRTNCGSVRDGTGFSRGRHKGHISFALLASFCLLWLSKRKIF